MKKTLILLAVACLVFVSCGNRAEKAVPTDETTSTYQVMLDKWDTWADLDEEGQVALVGEMKAFFDECCQGKCEKECENAEEVCPEKAAKCAEFKAKWETFETLTLEEQKALIDEIIAHKAECCKNKEACNAEGNEETCNKE